MPLISHTAVLTHLHTKNCWASNVAATFSQEFKVISGVNLPMIIEAEMLRSQNHVEEIVERAMFSATDGIKDISKMMEERMKE